MKKKNSKPILIFGHRAWLVILAVWVVFGISFGVWYFGFRSTVEQNTSFTIAGGASITSVARQLRERNLIESEDAFKITVRMMSGNVKRGLYDIPAGSSTFQIARMMARGDIATTTIMIPEGLTVQQIVAVLDRNEFLTGRACVGANNACPRNGDLFPDTYRVAKGTSRAAVIELMRLKKSDIRHHFESGRQTFPRPLTTWDEVIIMASIVQKETPKKAEMPKVAAVFLNRLNQNMRLQADPTVVYAVTDGLGDMQGRQLLRGHLQRPHPFNTYLNHGLPPAPIANVGRAAIAAVLNPADIDYLFFVADGTGGHVFSRTYEEHRANHERWREIRDARR